ncbi:MAG: hypothetical protein LUF89_00340 [Ruminococcus sp.]|nr:hypothetical protein [Ruminococcus sp.]
MDSSDTFLVILALILCVLHIWFSAAMVAIRTLSSQLHTLQETYPKLAYYSKRKATLICTVAVEMIANTVFLTVCAYFFAAMHGWLSADMPHRWI